MDIGASWWSAVVGLVAALAVIGVLASARGGWGSSTSARVTVPTAPETVVSCAQDAAVRLLSARPRATSPDHVELVVGTSWSSWGEVLRITAHPGTSGTDVSIESRSRLRATLVDWGKNRRNVDAVRDAVAGLAL